MDLKQYDLTKFKAGIDKLEVHLDDHQISQFVTYYELLVEWNRFMNLTAITEFNEVCMKHFIDADGPGVTAGKYRHQLHIRIHSNGALRTLCQIAVANNSDFDHALNPLFAFFHHTPPAPPLSTGNNTPVLSTGVLITGLAGSQNNDCTGNQTNHKQRCHNKAQDLGELIHCYTSFPQ